MWPRKIAGMTPYHPLRSFLFFVFLSDFLFPFFKPSWSASAPARGSKLRTPPPPPHVPCSQYTPLHAAAVKGHLEICKYLVELKADVAAKDRRYDPLPSVEELLFVFAFSSDFLFPFFRTVVVRLCPRPWLKVATIPPPPSRPLQSIHPAVCGCRLRALGDLQIFGGSQS